MRRRLKKIRKTPLRRLHTGTTCNVVPLVIKSMEVKSREQGAESRNGLNNRGDQLPYVPSLLQLCLAPFTTNVHVTSVEIIRAERRF